MTRGLWIGLMMAVAAAVTGCATGSTVGTGGSGGGTSSSSSSSGEAPCGNGTIDEGESCDDGAASPGDGCSDACAVEDGYTCKGVPSVCSPTCGDGKIKGGEACDDGAVKDGDGCSATCTLEEGFSCGGEPSECLAICGDGKILGTEQCDDGGSDDGDGCSSACIEEPGYDCMGEPSVCATVCGDGVVTAAFEQCDDGGVIAGDGCSDTCTVEDGFVCMGEPSTCMGICGDGQIKGAETCDDGGAAPGDGCSDTCATEPGWVCSGEPSVCNTVCGDGIVAGVEQCDDMDMDTGDGCTPACTLEDGWTCNGSPSACAPICGDGKIKGGEQCEDGNAMAGDGCSATCMFEAVCANGIVEPGEQCDDMNFNAGDGCDQTCKLEAGTVCGNAVDLNTLGVVVGNTTTYDGSTTPSNNVTFGDPSCSTGAVGVKRVLHRYTIGPKSAVLTIETVNVAGSFTDPVIWAYQDCQDTSVELACDDDSGPGLYSLMKTKVLPAGTTVFIVVSGDIVAQSGTYQLKVTETTAVKVSASGSCAMPLAVGPGIYEGVTLATDANNDKGGCVFNANMVPDAVYQVTTTATVSDITAVVTPLVATYDPVLYITVGDCGVGPDLVCKDGFSNGVAESAQVKNLSPGTYYVFVDGYALDDVGPYQLSIDVVGYLGAGEACVPAGSPACAMGLTCTGPMGSETCQ